MLFSDWEMAQEVQCLLFEHKGLSVSHRSPVKQLGVVDIFSAVEVETARSLKLSGQAI